MSIKKVTRLSVFAGIVVFTLTFSAGTSWGTESKPCKEQPATTTTAKPRKPTTTTTVKSKRHSTTTTVKPTTTTTEKPKAQQVTTTTQVAPKAVPSTTTTVEVAGEQIETKAPETKAEGGQTTPLQLASASQPTELAHTGIPVAPLSLFAAALCGIGWVVLWMRGRFAG
jgi:hypothetical protein